MFLLKKLWKQGSSFLLRGFPLGITPGANWFLPILHGCMRNFKLFRIFSKISKSFPSSTSTSTLERSTSHLKMVRCLKNIWQNIYKVWKASIIIWTTTLTPFKHAVNRKGRNTARWKWGNGCYTKSRMRSASSI